MLISLRSRLERESHRLTWVHNGQRTISFDYLSIGVNLLHQLYNPEGFLQDQLGILILQPLRGSLPRTVDERVEEAALLGLTPGWVGEPSNTGCLVKLFARQPGRFQF